MKTVTPLQLSANIDHLLEEVLSTGVPIEVRVGNRKLRIVPVETTDKLQNLPYRPDFILGDPDDLVEMNWGDQSQELPLDTAHHDE